MYFSTDETIVALSSALGPAARAILRLSGPHALILAQNVFHSIKQPQLDDCTTAQRLTGYARLPHAISLPAELYLFKAPHSYTGQHLAELHLPGSPPLLHCLLETLQQAGARPAQPGEFTARAFLNHRLDLSQAEAVAELINARSDAQLRGAERLLDGALRRHTKTLADALANLLALVEAAIDFTDQDIYFASPRQLRQQLAPLRNTLQRLLNDSISWQQLNHLPQVVLAGPANAGKSSLTNALTGIDRSIVTALAGTTRDLLTVPLALPAGECLLIDTAGLGQVNDILAGTTQSLARHAAQQSELLIYLVDVADSRTIDQIKNDLNLLHQLRPIDHLVVLNKIDACANWPHRKQNLAPHLPPDCLPVSAATGQGLDHLKTNLAQRLHTTDNLASETLALTTRQRHELQAAHYCLQQTHTLLKTDTMDQIELIALELTNALDHLGTVSGALVTEEVLSRIFSRFCIGK